MAVIGQGGGVQKVLHLLRPKNALNVDVFQPVRKKTSIIRAFIGI
jgi:hypothetical protein